MVEDRRAAGEGELGKPRPRGRVLRVGVQLRPHRVKLAQPLEEVRLLGASACQRLEEVVVRVDETGREDRSAEIDNVVRGRRRAASISAANKSPPPRGTT